MFFNYRAGIFAQRYLRISSCLAVNAIIFLAPISAFDQMLAEVRPGMYMGVGALRATGWRTGPVGEPPGGLVPAVEVGG